MMIAKLTKRRTHVKPETPGDDNTRWLVTDENVFETFVDDLHRAGVRTALYNLWWIIRH